MFAVFNSVVLGFRPIFSLLGQGDLSADAIQKLIDAVSFAVDSAVAARWVALAIAVVQISVFVLKRIKTEFVKKYGRIFVLVASAAASVLSLVDGGSTWKSALLVFLASGASTFLHDLLHAVGALKHRNVEEGADKQDVSG